MDFFRRNLAVAQQQAAEAAAKAKALAAQVTDKSQNLAQQASHNAKVLAQQVNGSAQEIAQQVTSKTKQMAEQARTSARNFSTEDAKGVLQKLGSSLGQKPAKASKPSARELEVYGINEDFLVFLRSLTYSTFRDFSETPAADNVGFVDNGKGELRLNPWQEQHANLVLRTVEELQDLRYVLCPRRMEEERFWKIYFSLAYENLPEGCRTGELPDPKGHVGPSEESEAAPPLVGQYTFVQNREPGSREQGDEIEGAKDDHHNGGPGPRPGSDLDKDDDLDVYLENVLNERREDSESGSVLEDFEDFEEYMDQLQDEIASTGDPVEVNHADAEMAGHQP